MPILCLEGPSAVGKTTTAAALPGAAVVPEANLLFARPADEPPDWYFRRQLDRWAMAARAAGGGALAVLDGDPFQPLWYNWTYAFARFQPLDALEALYRPAIGRGEISFPDRYVILLAAPDELRRRREGDATRRRSGFDAHLPLVETLPRYFGALDALSPGLVRFVEARDPHATARAAASAAENVPRAADPLALFDGIVRWLRENPAG